MRQIWLALIVSWIVLSTFVAADDAPPRSLDSRIKIELFAEQPQVATPTGIDVDHRGRVWVIESNTHFPPEGYKGHPTDRLLVMSDTDGDGKADRVALFTDELKHAMSVALRPVWFSPPAKTGELKSSRVEELKREKHPSEPSSPQALFNSSTSSAVYVATRGEIALFHDDDGDDKADRKEQIVRLETKGVYPHNGLAGFAFDAIGWMYFGFGENEGAAYKIIGSDGTTLSGGGEGGSLYRCRLDGSKLERWATGFWNPHASCVDAFGRLFTVDNDADSRPPCRLLHIIQGGDYGFRYRNGRKGLHPFTSWNGEIPGTLPMVAGTGEAPSGILAYENDGLPEEYIGNLLVTSWGDHRIDRFRLKPKGASFESLAEPLIVGGENFRPVGIACAPDGSLYVSDWVLRDYKVHGKGRVWRIGASGRRGLIAEKSMSAGDRPVSEMGRMLGDQSQFRRRIACRILRGTPEGRRVLVEAATDERNSTRARYESLNGLALVPVEDEWMRVFVVIGKSVWNGRTTNRIDEASTCFIRLCCAGTPQVPHLENESDCSLLFGEGTLQFVADGISGKQPVWSDPTFPLAPLETFRLRSPDTALDSPDSLYPLILRIIDRSDPFVFSTLVSGIDKGLRHLASLGHRVNPNDKFEADFVAMKQSELTQLVSRSLDVDQTKSERARLAFLLGVRRTSPANVEAAMSALRDPGVLIRRAAVQWVAEERLADLRPKVEAVLNDPTITSDLFLATLAALEMLDGIPPNEFDKTPPGKYVLPLVRDEKRPASVRALALRMVDPNDAALDDKLLETLLASTDPALRLEALRTLQQSTVDHFVERTVSPFVAIAADENLDINLRAEALVGLARRTPDGKLRPDNRDVFLKFLSGNNAVLQREAVRSSRAFVTTDADLKRTIETIAKEADSAGVSIGDEARLALSGPGGSLPRLADLDLREAVKGPMRETDDPAAGRRAFYRADGVGCSRCHTINGRGGRVGPDLSTIGRALTREKLVDSILEPSKEIAPQFVNWAFETTAGKVHTGMLVFENEGKTTVGDAEGKLTELKTIDIVNRLPQKTSVMPEKLAERMSVQEFRDLLAFLEGQR